MAEERRALHVYLSESVHDAITLFAQDVDKAMSEGGDATDVRQPWVKAARKIDAIRRRRGGA
jgi:hypothetical protein